MLAAVGQAGVPAPAANVAAEVVDRFLAKKENTKGAAESAGGYG